MKYGFYNDHFQNYKVYGIPKAQLVIADIPYNVGANAYGSNPMWYVGGGITKTGKASWRARSFLILIKTSELWNLCIFAQRC